VYDWGKLGAKSELLTVGCLGDQAAPAAAAAAFSDELDQPQDHDL